MKIRKAVITAAGKNQRTLPLQTLVDRDGADRTVLRIIIEETLTAGIEQLCIVVNPGDELPYSTAAGERAPLIRFVEQTHPHGYAHALYCARDFTGSDPFLHLVSDHLYISHQGESCAQELIKTASEQNCAVSSVQPTRENVLNHYGAVAGQKLHGHENLYRIDTVIEKPTPTEAEQRLIVTGMRAGHYLCFFGMHVLTPALMDILGRELPARPALSLSAALAELAKHEQYLALATSRRRYDAGVKYGLLRAQLALALSGSEREEVLAQLLEVLATRNLETA